VTEHRSQLSSAWSVLTPPRDHELSTFPIANTSGADVRAAVDRHGRRHLLVGGEAPVEPLALVGVLSVQVRTLLFAGVGHLYLDVCCTDPELDSQFHEVAADVLATVDRGADPVADALTVIERWRRLLRASALATLRENERLGLFAELSVLEALCRDDEAVAAAHWVGPLRGAHDFELEATCVEVKAVGRESSTVTVHGFEQLDTHDGRPLYLLIATVLDDPDGLSIPELVVRLRHLLADDPDFDRRLASARVDLTDPVLNGSSYSVTSLSIVAVDASTPRIVASSFVAGCVPEGLDLVRYQVDAAVLFAQSKAVNLTHPSGWWLE
jgi:Putative  PD-(D/E)XK family member, (DUF4420)